MRYSAALRDAYRQPGFEPEAKVYVEDPDLDTFLLPLHRSRKKTPVESAGGTFSGITIASCGEVAISTAAVEKFSSNFRSDGSTVLGAV